MKTHITGIIVISISIHIFTTLRWQQAFLKTRETATTDTPQYVPHERITDIIPYGNVTQSRRYGIPLLKQPRAFHPHEGAVDEFGYYGYVHDPTILRQTKVSNTTLSPEERSQVCAPLGQGPEGGNTLGRELFGRHIQVSSSTTTISSSIKVFCALYTYPGNKNQVKAIRETWGRKCDGFMAASTETIHEDATVNLLHSGGHRGMYKGIWQKVRSMLGYIYDNFLNAYDFFFVCGDDTYLIMENLKAFLTNSAFVEHAGGPSYPRPVYTGAWIHPFWLLKEYSTDFYYMGGGAGYILNRAAVRDLVELAWPTCRNTTIDSTEDVFTAECLLKHLNVTGYDARDEQERERFIPHDPIQLAMMTMPVSDAQLAKSMKKTRNSAEMQELSANQMVRLILRKQSTWLQRQHNWTAKYGIDCIAESAISFHMIQPAIKMRRYEQLLYHMKEDCDRSYKWNAVNRTSTRISLR